MAKITKLQARSAGSSGGVDLEEVERLLGFMDKHSLEEFEYERDGLRIRLKKASAHSQGGLRVHPAEEVVAHSTTAPHHAGAAAPTPSTPRETAGDAGRSEDIHVVKSPIVGTFYASATPGSEAFVSVGAQVETGQVLCIIEAMKLMNEIEADVAGQVVRVFVENGQPVEYGEPLFGIHPHRKK